MGFLFGFRKPERPYSPTHVTLLCDLLFLFLPSALSPEPVAVGEEEGAKSHSQGAPASGGQIGFAWGTVTKH